MRVNSGSFELSDDGDSLNLIQLREESVVIKGLKEVGQIEIRTRTKLGLFSEKLCQNGSICRIEPDRQYKNVFLAEGIFKDNLLRTQLASKGLKEFETVLKAVIIENCEVDWRYECEESKSNWKIGMKTRLTRIKALFNSSEFIIEQNEEMGAIIVRSSLKKIIGIPVIRLYNGFPISSSSNSDNFEEEESFRMCDEKQKDIFYINKREKIERIEVKRPTPPPPSYQTQFKSNKEAKLTVPRLKKSLSHTKGYLEAAKVGRSFFNGPRDTMDLFKLDPAYAYKKTIPGKNREFMKHLVIIGQFDKKGILAKGVNGEIWIFDQHACAERINLENLLQESKINSIEEMKMKACRSAIKFGDFLTISEQANLIKSLSECNEPFHCAHGRPTCYLLLTFTRAGSRD